MRIILPVLLLLLATKPDAQTRASTPPAAGATVRGVVHDSVAGRPLAGARVQLVADDSLARFGQTVLSDSTGRFSFGDVPDGRYVLGFFHPALDSLGVEPTLRAVRVDGGRAVRADLAIPGPQRLRAAVCGAASRGGSGGVVVGVVRDARGLAPAAGVAVTADWVELSLGRGGVVSRRTASRVATTNDGGWFALCDVPSPGVIALAASRAADSTDRVEIEVPAHGFVRRALYLGAARTVTVSGGAQPHDTAATRQSRVGDARLTGRVLAADGGRPLAGVLVAITGGPQTRTDARGEWAIENAPAGTRAIEVRALGYYPVRRAVDVIDGAPPANVSLSSLKSVLEAVKVTAAYNRYERLQEFQQRSRSGGTGRFLTEAQLARHANDYASDIFRNVPGLYVDNRHPDTPILMRGLVADRCAPTMFINGARMDGLTIADVDTYVRPRELLGIEVYSAGMVPPQFQGGMTPCGSIVIWTR